MRNRFPKFTRLDQSNLTCDQSHCTQHLQLESFVGSWILEGIAGKLDDRQYGGLKWRSTTHVLVDVLRHWHHAATRLSDTQVHRRHNNDRNHQESR